MSYPVIRQSTMIRGLFLIMVSLAGYTTFGEDPEPAPTAKKPTSTTKPLKKPVTKKPQPRFTVLAAQYGTAALGTDLTKRMQTASNGELLVVFVEKDLSENRKQGELFLRIKAGNDVIDTKFAHRKFVFLDYRPPPKFNPKGLTILDAFYGAGIYGEDGMVDVKDLLAARVTGKRVVVSVKDLMDSIPDPAEGVSKALIVRYVLDGQLQTVLFEEHQDVLIGGP